MRPAARLECPPRPEADKQPRSGLRIAPIEIGDEVEVEGFLARSDNPLVNTSSVQIFRTGQRLEAATPE